MRVEEKCNKEDSRCTRRVEGKKKVGRRRGREGKERHKRQDEGRNRGMKGRREERQGAGAAEGELTGWGRR